MIPRLCEEIFASIEDLHRAGANIQMTQRDVRKVKATVTVSFLEIYNEKV